MIIALCIVLEIIFMLFFLWVNAVLGWKAQNDEIEGWQFMAGFFLSAIPMSLVGMYLGGVFG